MVTATAAPSSSAVRSRGADLVVRPLRPGDGLAVRRLFRATLPVGRRLALQWADLVNYERQCIDWHLTRGRAGGRVLDVDGRVVAAALVCLDHRALDLWTRQRAVLWTGRATHRWVLGRLGRDGRHLARLRVKDALQARRDPGRRPFPASAVVTGDVPGGDRWEVLAGAVDAIVRDAGVHGWSFDVDVRDRAELRELEAGGHILTRVSRHHTASWLADDTVWRATVGRWVRPAS